MIWGSLLCILRRLKQRSIATFYWPAQFVLVYLLLTYEFIPTVKTLCFVVWNSRGKWDLNHFCQFSIICFENYNNENNILLWSRVYYMNMLMHGKVRIDLPTVYISICMNFYSCFRGPSTWSFCRILTLCIRH